MWKICLYNVQFVKNIFAHNVWCKNIKEIVIKYMKWHINNGAVVQAVECLLLNQKDVII
jgi:hypothetical protein